MYLYRFILIFIFIVAHEGVYAQPTIIVAGVVNDKNYDPVPNAWVYSSSGDTAYTDAMGTFYLKMQNPNDSLYARYKQEVTHGYAFPANKVISIMLNIYLHESSSHHEEYLPDVTVFNKNYYADSLRNRSEYARIYNAPSSGKYLLNYLANPLNLGNLFSGLKFKQNKKRQFYKDFAISIEQDKYVKHKFTKALVLKYTGLTGAERDAFMAAYAPTYEQILLLDDIHLAQYIIDAFKKYQTQQK